MLEKIDLNDFVNEFELPKTTKFIGYGVHLVDSDEFLHSYKINKEVILKSWCQLPDEATTFKSLKKANRIKNEVKPEAIVVWMFDIGKQIIVTTPEEIA